MKYKLQIQKDTIGEAVRARFTMIIPILRGMLNITKGSILEQAGGRDKITLEMFARVYAEKPGDYGICFEYAVHQALKDRDKSIHPLVSEVLEDFCKIKGDAESILFGIEKNGTAKIIETAKNSMTDEARVLVGKRGNPPLLKPRLDDIAKAFHSKKHVEKLPQSIRGLWRADLFIGSPSAEKWVATTLKTNRNDFVEAPGLRLGLYPEERKDKGPRRDGELVLCPLPYSGDFMQLFGASFQIIVQVFAAKGAMPKPVALVYDDDRTVAKWLADRAQFPVVDVLEALEPLKQPGLIEEQLSQEVARTVNDGKEPEPEDETEAAAPIPEKTR